MPSTAPANAPVTSRQPNCIGTRRLGVLGSWSVTNSPPARIVRMRHSDRMRHPLRPGAVEVDPVEHPGPGHHRGRGQRAQPGDHTDQQSEQQNQEMRHARPSGPGGDVTRTLTRTPRLNRPKSEAAEPDVGGQDRLGPDRRQLVHDRVDVAARAPVRAPQPSAGSASGAMVGDSRPGVIGGGLVERRTRAVVVEHQVLLTEHHALDTRDQLLTRCRVAVAGVGTFDQHRLRITKRLTECDQIVQTQRATGADDVGDGVGHAELRPRSPRRRRGE